MWFSADSGVSASKLMMRRVGLVLAAVEVLDVVDQPAVVLEPALHPAGVGAAQGVGAGVVDLVGHGVVVDGLDDLELAAGRSSRTTISRPLLRKAISRNRLVIVSKE